ncbi:MAG: formyltransferase family protein, partial [Planctomycetia bacterium]
MLRGPARCRPDRSVPPGPRSPLRHRVPASCGSLLPRHRGAAPIQWALLEGDPITGVSVIHMT